MGLFPSSLHTAEIVFKIGNLTRQAHAFVLSPALTFPCTHNVQFSPTWYSGVLPQALGEGAQTSYALHYYEVNYEVYYTKEDILVVQL